MFLERETSSRLFGENRIMSGIFPFFSLPGGREGAFCLRSHGLPWGGRRLSVRSSGGRCPILNHNLRAERGFEYKGSDVAAMIGDVSRPVDGWRDSPGRPGLPPQSLFFLNSLTVWRQRPSPGVGGAGNGGWANGGFPCIFWVLHQ